MSENIGENIRIAREQKGLTQEELAGKLKMSRLAVGKIERGESNITIKRLEEIATVLEKSPADFLSDQKGQNITAPVSNANVINGAVSAEGTNLIIGVSDETIRELTQALNRICDTMRGKANS